MTAQKKLLIAVVDDEPQITKLLKLLLLDNFNCEVETFNSSTEAIQVFQTRQFDVISLDHRMPQINGMEIVRLLRSSNCPNINTKIILLTGHREEAENRNVEILDEVFFLEKPIEEMRYIRWMSCLLKVSPKP